MSQPDFATLENQARLGDATAFGALIRHYDNDLRGVVWAVVRSQVDTDDVMQTAYEKAFRSLGTFDGKSTMKTWLHSICYRSAIDHVRYEGRRRHESIDDVVSLGNPGSSVSELATAGVDVGRAFEQLSEEHRVLLMLTIGLGYSFDETAEIVGMRRGTVASKVSRARTKLKRGGGDSDG